MTHLKEKAMEKQHTGTREQWLAARLELLAAQKDLTLDRAPLGRNEKSFWFRRHDEYATR